MSDMQRRTYAPAAMAALMAGNEDMAGIVDCALGLYTPDGCLQIAGLMEYIRANQYTARARMLAAQNVNSGVNVLIQFDGVEDDDNTSWERGVGAVFEPANFGFRIQRAGVYTVNAQVALKTITDQLRTFTGIFVNGVAARWGMQHSSVPVSIETQVPVNDDLNLEAGDLVTIYAHQLTGGAVAVGVNNNVTWFSLRGRW